MSACLVVQLGTQETYQTVLNARLASTRMWQDWLLALIAQKILTALLGARDALAMLVLEEFSQHVNPVNLASMSRAKDVQTALKAHTRAHLERLSVTPAVQATTHSQLQR